MIRVHCSTVAETDAAWGWLTQIENPAELYLDGVGLIAIVERDPVSRRLVLRRSAADPASAPHKAPQAHTAAT